MKLGIIGLSLLLTSIYMLLRPIYQEIVPDADSSILGIVAVSFAFGLVGVWLGYFGIGDDKEDK